MPPLSLSLTFSSFKPNQNLFSEVEAQSHQEKETAQDISKSLKYTESPILGSDLLSCLFSHP